MTDRKVKIAQYRRIDDLGPWETVSEYMDSREDSLQYVRISEPLEVEFMPRDDEEIVPAQVAALDKEIEAVRAVAHAKVARLEDRRNKLLAITHNPDKTED